MRRTPPPVLGKRRVTAMLTLVAALALLASCMAPLAPPSRPDAIDPTTGDRLEVIERYEVVGSETWEVVVVATDGQLVVPEGTSLVAGSVELNGYCMLELTGGEMVIHGTEGVVGLSGQCRHLRVVDGSRLSITGGDGGPALERSAGSSVGLDLAFTHEVVVMDSTILLEGGDGGSPGAPETTGPLAGDQHSGGEADLVFRSLSEWGRISVMNSTLEVVAGAGGDAPDGLPPDGNGGGTGGGFSEGGDVSGRVGAGGHASITMDADQLFVDRSVMTCQGGGGGDGGDGGGGTDSQGSGGGGYSGGTGAGGPHEVAQAGGRVSGEVGSGGDARLAVTAQDLRVNGTAIEVTGGDGGDAGDGGDSRGHPGYGGGAGGGGYSGGGGGSPSEPEGASGGDVDDLVGSGGKALVTMRSGMMLEMEGTSVELTAGQGGRAGDGGVTINFRGAGGGGYSGGGGAGLGDLAGQEARLLGGDGGEVSGSVARGAYAGMSVNATRGIVNATDLTVTAGDGGDGGSPGRSFFNHVGGDWSGGGGGGSYSAGGGGGFVDDRLSICQGGEGGPVEGEVGDGGDAELRLNIDDPTIHRTCRLAAGRGDGGMCWRADAMGGTGGDGVGRPTSRGRAVRYIPQSTPVLLTPGDGTETNGTPIFNWTLVSDTTTNGRVTAYDIQFSLNRYFDAVFMMFMVSQDNITVESLPKGAMFWRVRALFARPPGVQGDWSTAFRYVHTNSPPTVDEIPVVNVTVKHPRTVDLGPYLKDTDDPKTGLVVDFPEDPRVLWHAGTQVTLFYEEFEEEHELEFTVSDGHDRTTGWLPVRVIDRNRSPVIRMIGNQTPPAAFNMDEGRLMYLPVQVVDLDGDPVGLSLVSTWSGGSILPNGTLLIEAAVGDVGTYTMVLTAEDGRGGYDRAEVSVRVGNVGEPPLPPVFLSPLNGTVFQEGEQVTFDIRLEDPDFIYGDTVSVTVVSDLSGVLIGLEANDDLVFTTDRLAPGEHHVTALVKDGPFSARAEVHLVVLGEPETPPVWDPPDWIGTLLVMIVLSMVSLGASYYVGYRLKNR